MYTYKAIGDLKFIAPADVPENIAALIQQILDQNNKILQTNAEILELLLQPAEDIRVEDGNKHEPVVEFIKEGEPYAEKEVWLQRCAKEIGFLTRVKEDDACRFAEKCLAKYGFRLSPETAAACFSLWTGEIR